MDGMLLQRRPTPVLRSSNISKCLEVLMDVNLRDAHQVLNSQCHHLPVPLSPPVTRRLLRVI
jgi:hypothetical protein